MPLTRNVHFIPHVFFAGLSLIASEAVAKELSRFEHVHLSPCVWDRVYREPMDEDHVRSLCERFSALTDEYDEWLETRLFPPPADLHARRYYEVLVPRLESVRPAGGVLAEFPLPGHPGDRLPPLRTAAGVHRTYPVLREAPYYLCNQQVFDVLQPHVGDPALFTALKFQLPD